MIKYTEQNIINKNISVIGAGISGIGAASLANYLGAKVILIDENKKLKIEKNINLSGVKLYLGNYPNKIMTSQLIIISPGVDYYNNKHIQKLTEKNIPIISEIEFASWFTKSKIIAITGSNGKSTVVKLLFNILKRKYKNTFLGGNIGISFCENVLDEIKNKKNKILHLLEISSFQLEKIVHFNPHISCILNISKDHLERYNNYKEYYETKFKIFNKKGTNIIFYNQGNRILNKEYNHLNNSISFTDKYNFYIKNKKIYNAKTKKNIIDLNKVNLIGKHNYENILAALNIALKVNIKEHDIVSEIYKFKPLNHRMEIVNINNAPLIINDSKATNIKSTICAVKSFNKKILLILGGFTESKIEKNILLKIINIKNVISFVCYGQIGNSLHKIIKNYKKSKYINDFKEAVVFSLQDSSSKEIIMFSPGFKSFDQFKDYQERGNTFKKIINNYYN